ncbi:unnamed protein product [Tilletia controversa]|uniref:Dipeptidase n=1 Tax=Tilletia controversa TaxID=13291 RepID=A0A8X7N206_9BASI|nr:hypothetical protein CF328_g178 [Tilletia controversa]KAE8255660.1 hypothetical protein A4X06_0g310 [Tilletia controversa]CAD6901881.1 unnamed protein product [Tilletia controversa]CAD6971928.1 unnamed protein product [Tilletia controversa]
MVVLNASAGEAFAWLLASISSSVFGGPTASQSLSVARDVLKHTPLIDGHVDLPVVARILAGGDISKFPYDKHTYGQVDVPRLREGKAGGFFSIAYVPCGNDINLPEGENFTNPTNAVRDTLEQIDLTYLLESHFPRDVAVARSVAEIRHNFAHGKISHIPAIEGAHSLGNSLGTLRSFVKLGVKYITLTHTCHNAFADSAGSVSGVPLQPLHHGLSDFGKRLVKEMNRLGVLVDISHTSDDTARQAIELSEAPVMFSHSGSRVQFKHIRNVPDDVLQLLPKAGAKDGIVMVPAVNEFVAPNATVAIVADHIDHIANIVGRSRVGLGTDFDGGPAFPKGLEDTSKYPNLLAELHQRGWSYRELQGFAGENLLRIMRAGELVAAKLQKASTLPDSAPWEGRPDIGPGKGWFRPPQL